MKYGIELTERQHSAVARAIYGGAFASQQAQFTALMQANKEHERICDNLQQDADDLTEAARKIVNAQPVEPVVDPINKLTDDDIIHACQVMEAESQTQLASERGHFMTAYSNTIREAAKAFYHADTANRRLVRAVFGGLYVHFHRVWAIQNGKEAKV